MATRQGAWEIVDVGKSSSVHPGFKEELLDIILRNFATNDAVFRVALTGVKWSDADNLVDRIIEVSLVIVQL